MGRKNNKMMVRAIHRNFDVMKVNSADILARTKKHYYRVMSYAVKVHDGNCSLGRDGKLVSIWERPYNKMIGDYPVAERVVHSHKALVRFLIKNKVI